MVRTKADGACRVAAGGKAPSKKSGGVSHSPSPSPTEKVGKDYFPGNRYCPRDTPTWQKTITNFFERGGLATPSSSKENRQPEAASEAVVAASPGSAKRKSRELADNDEIEVTVNERRQKRLKSVSEENHLENEMETDN